MDLFHHVDQTTDQSHRPLADRLRPQTIENFVGQTQAVGPKSALSRMLAAGHIPSLILWGPPGCGKTTLAQLIARQINAEFVSRNAIDTGAKVLRDLGVEAHRRRLERNEKTILFIDEIHRLNKGQQDVLLPHLENGDLTLIGATTENPSYELNSALLSRCRLVVFQKLNAEDLQRLMERGLSEADLKADLVLTKEGQERLLEMADGDGRRLLNSIEQLMELYRFSQDSFEWPLSAEHLQEAIGAQALYYDRDRDQHYDTISAFIKSIRGSDPSAGLYYLARMLKGGEDPVFIARRLVILASEDVGNADPRALSIAVAGAQAVELIGLPEASINLAQVVTYLASAPKSNRSYEGLRKAEAEVERSGSLPIPLALRSAQKSAMKKIGYGRDYKYSHSGDKGYVAQQFLPDEIQGETFYDPAERGFEKTIRQYMAWLKGES